MSFEQLKEYISMGNEIEFTYDGKRFSITYYYPDADNEDSALISFCEFYKETTEVSTVDELWNSVCRYGHTVGEMLSSVSDNDVSIF